MALDVKQLTELSQHSSKAQRHLDQVRDFVDLVKKDAEQLEGDVMGSGDKIEQLSSEVDKHLQEIKKLVEDQLNKVPIDEDATKDAAKKLILYHDSLHQVIAWADGQKSNHPENSYWWRYWVSVLDNVMQDAAYKGDLEKIK